MASAVLRGPALELPLQPQLYDYHTVDAFPGMTFVQPVRTVSPPGETGRLFVVEQTGRVYLIEDLEDPRRSVFLDLTGKVHHEQEGGLLDLAFHPRFAQNGIFFVFYTLIETSTQGNGLHDRLSRFQVMEGDPSRADPGSETVLINQFDEHIWHNGGCLGFGPDGYLYISLGDEGWGLDFYGNAQRIDRDFFSGILRIDPDMRPGSLAPNPHPASRGHYRIPPDNPFVGVGSFNGQLVDSRRVRTEFYAVGMRNPWRFSFDSQGGGLYCNDAGQITREEVNEIVAGGNYGWSYLEGSLDGPRWMARPPGALLTAPLAEYGRQYGDGIAGGLLYRGGSLPGLDGHYLFSDFWAGFLGAVPVEGEDAGRISWLLWDSGVSDIGLHPASGEVLLSDWLEGRIKRLVPGPDPALKPLPALLSQTGAFESLDPLVPSERLEPYRVNVPFWSDHAEKERWFSLPPGTRFSVGEDGSLGYPTGTVWVKQFDMEMAPGDPSTRRRLETRFLVQTPFGVPYGATYRWNPEGTEAELVPPGGCGGGAAPPGKRSAAVELPLAAGLLRLPQPLRWRRPRLHHPPAQHRAPVGRRDRLPAGGFQPGGALPTAAGGDPHPSGPGASGGRRPQPGVPGALLSGGQLRLLPPSRGDRAGGLGRTQPYLAGRGEDPRRRSAPSPGQPPVPASCLPAA